MATNYQVSTLLTARNLTGAAFRAMQQSARAAYATVDRLKGGLVTVAGISGTLAGVWAVTAGAAVRMTADVAAASAAITDLSNASGVSQEALERLMNAGRMQGADVAALSKGVKRLALDMDKYNDATSSQYKALKEINPALAKQLSATTNTQDALELVTGAMLDATEAQRLQIAETVFGKMAADDYALALGMTRVEFSKLQDRMDRFNPPNTAAQTEAFASLDDSLEETRAAWEGTKKAFAGGVAPGLKTALDSLNGWLVNNRGQIESWGQSMGQWIAGIDWDNVARMVQMVMDAFKGGLAVVDGMATAFGKLSDMVGGADKAMMAILATWAAVKTAGVAKGIAGLGATAAAGATGGAGLKALATLGVPGLAAAGLMGAVVYNRLTPDELAREAAKREGSDAFQEDYGFSPEPSTPRAKRPEVQFKEDMDFSGAAADMAAGFKNEIAGSTKGAVDINVKVAVEGGQLVGTGVTKGAAIVGNVGVTGISARSGGAF